MNQEMCHEFKSPGIVTVIKVGRLEWLGVVRMDKDKDKGKEVTGRQNRKRKKT
jgi:hypothetical protein